MLSASDLQATSSRNQLKMTKDTFITIYIYVQVTAAISHAPVASVAMTTIAMASGVQPRLPPPPLINPVAASSLRPTYPLPIAPTRIPTQNRGAFITPTTPTNIRTATTDAPGASIVTSVTPQGGSAKVVTAGKSDDNYFTYKVRTDLSF